MAITYRFIVGVWISCMLALGTAAMLPTRSHAQAWLPDPGRGSLYVGYEYAQAHWTLFPIDVDGRVAGPYTGGPGKKAFHGEHYGQFVTVDLDYGIRQWLATTVHLAYVSSQYVGGYPHKGQNGLVVEADDGNYHGSLQDAEVTVRSMVLHTPFVATPFVAYRFPGKSYATIGHAAVGHHLRELRLGASLGRTLKPFLPDAYGQMTYAYSAAEREDDHSIHRNSLDMELGYSVTPRLALKGTASWVRSSGGIEWLSQDFRDHVFSHDALANERSWRVGGGAGYALTPRYQLYMVGFTTVSGANTHAMSTIATGIGWNFATPWAR